MWKTKAFPGLRIKDSGWIPNVSLKERKQFSEFKIFTNYQVNVKYCLGLIKVNNFFILIAYPIVFSGIKFWETTRDDGDAYCDEASVDEHRDAKQHVGWRGQKKN